MLVVADTHRGQKSFPVMRHFILPNPVMEDDVVE